MRPTTRTFIVCGGPHPTLSPESMFSIPGIDAVVRGEGEYPMRDLADALSRKGEFRHIRNLWVRDGVRIVKNEMRPLIADLDELPYPDKSCLDYQKTIDECTVLSGISSAEAVSSVVLTVPIKPCRTFTEVSISGFAALKRQSVRLKKTCVPTPLPT